MSRDKRLNIYNTDRKFNFETIKKEKLNSHIKVTHVTEKEIEEEMDRLDSISGRYPLKDNKTYLIYHTKYSNDTLHEKIYRHGGYVKYYTDSKVPFHVIESLSNKTNTEIIYYLQPSYSATDVANIHMASMATTVTIDAPIVLPDISPYDVLFALYPLRYKVDKVHLSFPSLTKEEMQDKYKEYYVFYNGAYHMKAKYKYQVFNLMQYALSTWKMNIFVVTDSDKDDEMVKHYVSLNNKRYKSDKKNNAKPEATGEGK